MTDNIVKVSLIVVVMFFVLFGALGFYFMAQVGSREKEGSLERQLEELEVEKKQLFEDIAKINKNIDGQVLVLAERKLEREVIVNHLDRLRVSRASFQSHTAIRKAHSENVLATENRVTAAIEGGSDDNAPTIQALRVKKENFEAKYMKRRDDLQIQIDDITKKAAKEEQKYRRREDEKRKTRDRLETAIVQIRENLQKFMVRDLPEIDMGNDGIVLTVDIESRHAVINVGRRQGIKPGMRFEVFRLQQGVRRIRKGYLVVRSASRETAGCIIVNMAIRLPRCPTDGYTARYPEEQFCPYDTGSAGGSQVQRLSAIPKATNLGMDPNYPIVAGDLIQNPLYESETKLHFAVKGDPDSPLARKWGFEDFIKAIKWHGGLIDADVSAQTDVLLTGKYAMDDTRKARELGVKVLRQYELFDFLRQ